MEKITICGNHPAPEGLIPLSPACANPRVLADRLLDGALTGDHPFAMLFEYAGTRLEVTRGFAGDGSGGQGAPIGFDTRFRLASVTKQLIARAVTELAFAGKLGFEDRLDRYFDGLPDTYAALTLRMLLNHTSGLPDYETMPPDGTDRQVLDADVPAYLRTLGETFFTPGSRYKYSNTAFVLLGLVIEKAAGTSLSDAMRELVFAPAGMEKTLVNVQGETVIPSRAYGHVIKDGRVIERDQYRWSATIGDGGVYSCVNDLERWIDDMLRSNDRLADTMLRDTVLPDGSATGYGMGIRLKTVEGRRIICHTGGTIGFNSAVMYAPELPLRLVFLTNREMNEPFDVINNALSLVFGKNPAIGG